jgi:TrmH family RNA methyltransferase
MSVLRSRDNARVRRWASLVRDAAVRKRERRAMAEGPHLVAAGLERGRRLEALVVSESGLSRPEIARLVDKAGMAPVMLADRLFRATFDVDSPQGVAAEISTDAAAGATGKGDLVFLEAVQDPGNVGAIIRSAAAFGAASVVVDGKCADPWSPKALRGGMGGHFSLEIRQCRTLEDELHGFRGTIVAAVSAGGVSLARAELGTPVGWLFGSEGAGLSAALAALAAQRVTIPIAASSESLNVAAAAAICLYEAASRRGRAD